MRSRAQIHESALVIERDLRILRQILDQFHLVGFTFFFHEFYGLRPGQRKAL